MQYNNQHHLRQMRLNQSSHLINPHSATDADNPHLVVRTYVRMGWNKSTVM